VDYRSLNTFTFKNKYPLPRIDILFHQLAIANVFFRVNIHSGYHQIKIHLEDVPKTTFYAQHVVYEYLVISFALTNALPHIMYLINLVFMPELDKFVMVFIDDILIDSKNKEEHQNHLRIILQRLREHQLYAKLASVHFG
jgi:hypothetical protein